ncbi:MAG: PilZ domain-containing protein [Nitrospinae bacterium]|nr:PilZ domain-containing protein [Nitrospinota bacterium]
MNQNKSHNSKRERRGHPRVPVELEVELAEFPLRNYGNVEKTRIDNFSCSGVYCKIKKFIPPMTKVMVNLSLPIKKNKRVTIIEKISLEGIVVRTEPENKSNIRDYNVAIFFPDLIEFDRKKIEKYLQQEEELQIQIQKKLEVN